MTFMMRGGFFDLLKERMCGFFMADSGRTHLSMNTKDVIKKAILRLLDQYSADDLSVKMVCYEAKISKQTLYNHYYCVMDAVEDAYRDAFNDAVSDCTAGTSWISGFLCVLRMLTENRSVVLHLYNSSHKDEFARMIYKYASGLVDQAIEEYSRNIGLEIDDRDRAFMLEFYMYVFMGITEKYIQGKMHEDPYYIAGRCEIMMHHQIEYAIKDMYLAEHTNIHNEEAHGCK